MTNKSVYFEQAFPFWNNLNSKEKNIIDRGSDKVRYPRKTLLSPSGEGCKGALILISGQLRVYIVSDEGREVTLYRIGKEESCVLSAACLLDSIAFDVHIEAIEDTEAIIVPSSVMNQIMKDNHRVELYFYKSTTERFSDVMWTMQQILFKGADKRLATFLWDEMIKGGSSVLTYTHEEMARYIGSAREVVTRILKYFANEGVVALSRGKIEIINKEELKKHL